jgi:ribosome-binding protein aMBF1 (putative translation factor)
MTTNEIIHRFSGTNRFLDNRFVEADGQTVTDRFEAVKAGYLGAESAGDWDAKRNDVMTGLVRAKFRDLGLRRELLATGDARLIDGGVNADRYCGLNLHTGGQNALGKILEHVREEIRSDSAAMAEIAAADEADRVAEATAIASAEALREALLAGVVAVARRVKAANDAAASDLVADLRHTFAESGMTVYELASRMDVSVKRASRIERADYNPKLSEIRQLASALGVTFQYSIS